MLQETHNFFLGLTHELVTETDFGKFLTILIRVYCIYRYVKQLPLKFHRPLTTYKQKKCVFQRSANKQTRIQYLTGNCCSVMKTPLTKFLDIIMKKSYKSFSSQKALAEICQCICRMSANNLSLGVEGTVVENTYCLAVT